MHHPVTARQKALLSIFSTQIQAHIIEFCKELSSQKHDVYILFARKAACFISVLESVQLLELNGKVVSERVLDHDLSWLKGKSVALVDDTIISGTSLYHIIQKLEGIGVQKIDVNVFCVNEFWFEENMLENSQGITYLRKPYLKVDHATSLKFCKDIVTLFSLYPRPYSTDFPIFESVRLKDYEFNVLQNTKDWRVVDTTSKLQLTKDIRCFSMSPKDTLIDGFFTNLGLCIEQMPYLKLRLYSERKTDNKGSFFLCRVLPLVIFDPIKSDLLQLLIQAICMAEDLAIKDISCHLVSRKGSLRFIQYYFAHRFFLYSIDYFKSYFNTENIRFADNSREVDLLFPPDLVAIVSKFKWSKKVNLITNTKATFSRKSDITVDEQSYNPLLVKDILYKKFLRLYYEKELTARRIVKEKRSTCLVEPDEKKIMNRLNDGFTFQQLLSSINLHVTNIKDRKLLVSNFLDNAIDSGIVVPVTIEADGFTSRGYRHGEEIVWGENNDKLVGIFYDRFLNSTNAAFIKRFWFEKLLVLFLRMGLKEKILEEYNYSVPPPQAVKIVAARSYLYGFVTASYELAPHQETKFNPVLDLETKGYWTSERFKDIGAIECLEGDENYYLKTDLLKNPVGQKKENEPEDLDLSFSDIAEEIGELLAIAKNDKVLTPEGLVLLTSCLTVHDCVASIAAEIYIYTRHIPHVISWIKSAISRSTLSISFLQTLRNDRKSKNYAWPAINSGLDKYLSFISHDGQKLVNNISEHFKKDSFKKRSWDKYWKKEIEVNEAEAPDIFALNQSIGLVLIEINITCIYLHLLIFEKLKRSGEVSDFMATLDAQYKSIEAKLEKCVNVLKQLTVKDGSNSQTAINFDKVSQVNSLEKEKDFLTSEMNRLSRQMVYWQKYVEVNTEKVKTSLAEFKNISAQNPVIYNEAIAVITYSYKNSLDSALTEEIDRCTDLMNGYKETSESLLRDFSALVPQWGKINPTVRYQGLIHLQATDGTQASRNHLKAVINSVMAEFEKNEILNNRPRSIVNLVPIRSPHNIGYFIGGSGRLKIDKMCVLLAKLHKACVSLRFPVSIVFYPHLEENKVIKAFYSTSSALYDSVHENFYDYFLNLEAGIPYTKESITIYDTFNTKPAQHYLKKLHEATGDNYLVSETKVPSATQPVSLMTFTITKEKMSKRKTIGIVTALPVEYGAMKIMLDNIIPMNSDMVPKDIDPNDYAFGTIRTINNTDVNIVIALMKKMGTNDAASTVTHMLRSYPDIEDVIMCGIAGGVPHPSDKEKHVRLGDIVVTDKSGILQYDNIKDEENIVKIRANQSLPSANLLGLCNLLLADTYTFETPWNKYIDEKTPSFKGGTRPTNKDILKINGVIVDHPTDDTRDERYPKVHFGAIGSANTLLKNETKRDYLRDNHDVRAIEMEGIGILDGTWQVSKGYLVVRGIVDYCNSDKNDDWRGYAAICAAAYTKAIIQKYR